MKEAAVNQYVVWYELEVNECSLKSGNNNTYHILNVYFLEPDCFTKENGICNLCNSTNCVYHSAITCQSIKDTLKDFFLHINPDPTITPEWLLEYRKSIDENVRFKRTKSAYCTINDNEDSDDDNDKESPSSSPPKKKQKIE